MSEPNPAGSSIAAAAPFGQAAHSYALSDLARLSLPAEYKDANRTLAWVNSICLLFLFIGLVGLKQPKIIVRPLSQVSEIQIEPYVPPQDQPKTQPEVKQEEPEPQETPVETPQVATVVAAADPTKVAFAVPVVGAIPVAEARYATPPPPVGVKPPTPTKFNPDVNDGGYHPKPDYPSFAARNHYQGTVTLEIMVDASGAVTSAKVYKASGFPILDQAALQTVKDRWRFLPGPPRDLIADFLFKLE
jgi:protein TonB